MARLFEKIIIGNLELKNRIVMSPMCMYRAGKEGKVTDFHKVHYATRAMGRAGLIILEATAITPVGRISESDLGIWSDDQIKGLNELVDLIHQFDSKAGIQLAHAGRKSRVTGSEPVAPSPLPFGDLKKPKEMDVNDIKIAKNAFLDGAKRAKSAGFDVIEIHAAHGFLINEFLSPITNKRNDRYGGAPDKRMVFLGEIIETVKMAVDLPVFVRISATDYVENGININDSIEIARELKRLGISLIDVSSGGISPDINILQIQKSGFNVEFSERIKAEIGIFTSAVGMITDPFQAESILQGKRADLIFLGRELLRNPYFAVDAQIRLGVQDIDIDPVYKRAYPV